jgi:hypothetical protein
MESSLSSSLDCFDLLLFFFFFDFFDSDSRSFGGVFKAADPYIASSSLFRSLADFFVLALTLLLLLPSKPAPSSRLTDSPLFLSPAILLSALLDAGSQTRWYN